MTPFKTSFALIASALFAGASWAGSSELDARWADLGSTDEGKATRALLALAATPKETTAFFKENLKPVKVDAKRVAQLLKALDSDTFVVRTQASVELEYFGKYIKAELEAAMKDSMKAETKMRLQQLLEKIPSEKKVEPMPPPAKGRPGGNVSIINRNGQITVLIDGQPIDFSKMTPPPPPPGPPQQWIRAVRAVTILEHLATPEARTLLETMANGERDALPTAAAKEALERLKK